MEQHVWWNSVSTYQRPSHPASWIRQRSHAWLWKSLNPGKSDIVNSIQRICWYKSGIGLYTVWKGRIIGFGVQKVGSPSCKSVVTLLFSFWKVQLCKQKDQNVLVNGVCCISHWLYKKLVSSAVANYIHIGQFRPEDLSPTQRESAKKYYSPYMYSMLWSVEKWGCGCQGYTLSCSS